MKNFLILFPVLTILIWASFSLWEDFDKKAPTKNSQQVETVGYITTSANTVKRKSEVDPLWYNLSSQEYVFDKDVIKTGVDSSTTIVLNDKTIISLDENSLVALEKTNSSFQIDLKLGDFSTKNTSENVILKVKDTIIQGNQADLFISTDLDNNTQVQVQKGNATITDKNNQQIKIDRNKLLEISANGKVQALQTVVLLSSPENNAKLKDPRLQVSYPFTWAVLVDDVKQETLEISQNEDFSGPTTKLKRGHQGIDGNIQQGINYWRVSWSRLDPTTNKQKIFYSVTRKIYLEGDDRVILSSPKDNTAFEFLPGEQNINFEWTTKEASEYFIIEISSTPNFRTIIKNEKINMKSFSIKDLNSAGYYWRVRAFDKNNTLQGLSQTRSFTVKNIFPSYPTLLSPSSQLVWSLNEPLLVEWKPYDKANMYVLTIAKDSEFKNISYTQKLSDVKATWAWSEEGKYYWQVAAYKDDLRISESTIDTFSIKPALKKDNITLLLPKNQELIPREKRKQVDPVVFEWKPQMQVTPKYQIHLSTSPNLSEGKLYGPISSLRHNISVDTAGTYYWKVDWLNEKNEVKFTSPIQVFQLQFTTSLPSVITETPIDKSIFYTPIDAKIEFQWQKVEEALQYRLTIEAWNDRLQTKVPYRDVKTTSNTNAANLEKVPPGKYFWKIRAIDSDKLEGTWSVEKTFDVELKEALGAPRLRPPVVK